MAPDLLPEYLIFPLPAVWIGSIIRTEKKLLFIAESLISSAHEFTPILLIES
jgi:hypothetical protein